MNRYFLTFATSYLDFGFKDLSYYQKLQIASAKKFGLTNIILWDRERLKKTDFYSTYKGILDQSRGAGYWLWKPYIIMDTLERIQEGDFVLYLDADIKIIADLGILFELCQENDGFFLIEERDPKFVARNWIKRDCFILMGMDDKKYYDVPMCAGGLQLYQKTDATMGFVSELLNISTLNDTILTDELNICGYPNLPGFVEHRHDQSVLTLLKTQYGIQSFRWPTQWGNHQKMEEFRVYGEYFEEPHVEYSNAPYLNSPYGTLMWALSRTPVPLYYKVFSKIISGFLSLQNY